MLHIPYILLLLNLKICCYSPDTVTKYESLIGTIVLNTLSVYSNKVVRECV